VNASSRRASWALAGLTAAALAARLWGIDRFVVDLHELFALHSFARLDSLGAFLSRLRERPLHLLLEPLLSYAFSRVSLELWWLRLAPVLTGTACVPVLYALGRRLGGTATGLAAAALLAFSIHHAEFSGFVDFYPALVLWTLLSTLALLRACETGGRRGFVLYGAALAGFLYTHPWAVIVLAFHGAWLARERAARLKPFLAAAGAALASFAPWFVYSLSLVLRDPAFEYSGAGHARPWTELWWTLRCWSGCPERGFFAPEGGAGWVEASTALHLALAALGAWRLRREGRWNAGWTLAALFVLGGVPAVFLADWAFAYDYMPRQSIFVLPFFLAFAAEGLLWAPVRRLAPAALALLLIPLSVNFSGQLTRMRSRFERAAAGAAAGARPGEALLFDEPNFAAWFLYYFDRGAFFRVGAPVLKDGFYIFSLPWGTTAGPGRPILVVWDPLASPEEERRRWEDLKSRLAAGTLKHERIHFSLMRPMARQKTADFLTELGIRL
jgi:hypothetical protein